MEKLQCKGHIVQLYDHCLGRSYLFFELLEGGDLADYIKSNNEKNIKVPEVTVADYVIQILEGLANAHAEGIIHRDLKPGNIAFADKERTILKVGF